MGRKSPPFGAAPTHKNNKFGRASKKSGSAVIPHLSAAALVSALREPERPVRTYITIGDENDHSYRLPSACGFRSGPEADQDQEAGDLVYRHYGHPQDD